MKKTRNKAFIARLTTALSIFVVSLVAGILMLPSLGIVSGANMQWQFEEVRLAQAEPFEYFKTDFDSVANLKKEAHSVSRQVQTEGSVLLMNNNMGNEGRPAQRNRPALPLNPATEKTVSLFDVTAVDPIWGGMGSGMAAVTGGRPANGDRPFNATGGFEAAGKTGIYDSPSFPVEASRLSWKTSLEDAGFDINEDLWDWYDGLPRPWGSGTNTGPTTTPSTPSPDSFPAGLRGTTHTSHMGTFNIGGASWNQMPASKSNSVDVGIFVLGRMGGEDFDRQMLSWDQGVPKPSHLGGTLRDAGNTQRSYLVLSDKERTVLDQLAVLRDNGTIGKLILIINASNQPELDWLTLGNEYNFDAAAWVGGIGQDGIDGIVDLLIGEQSFSGRLPQMFWNRHADNPVHANFGSYTFGTGSMQRSAQGGSGAASGEPDRYVVYQEGMYLGYRYAETRYEDVVLGRADALANGTWDRQNFNYSNVVAFPFGFGLSYTTFAYSNLSVARRNVTTTPVRPAPGRQNTVINKTFYDVTVTVTNTGTAAGREAVTVYLQRPYANYHIQNDIQIPSVELVGYDKSPVLQPNQSWTTTIAVDEKYFAAFDAWGEETFVATGGDYFLSLGNSEWGAHQAVNNILARKGKTTADGMTFNGTADMAWQISHTGTPVTHDFGASGLNQAGRTKYAISDATGNPVKNLFDHADINRFEAAQADGRNQVEYLSRNDWAGTVRFVNPTLREAQQHILSTTHTVVPQTILHRTPQMLAMMNTERSQIMDEVLGNYPTYGANNNLTFSDMAVRRPDGNLRFDYDDPKWDQFLDQLTWSDYIWLLSDGLRRTMDVETVGKPRSNEVNGPLGFSPRYGDSGQVNVYRHYSFRDTTQFPGGGFFVNFGVGEKDPGVTGFANIGVFRVPNYYGEGKDAFIPRRDTDWHRDLYRDTFGTEMEQILDPDHIAYTTAFPSNPIVAATFNNDLIYQVGVMIGEDALWAGYSGIYGTGINILRTAHQGRVFEYYSECGFLTGMVASAWSRGVQSKGTYVYNKHFVLNEQELSRYGVNQFLNEQTLREIYLRAFEIPIILDDAKAIMGTLARVGVEYGPASSALMTDWLRGEAGFSGFTVTDWWLGHHHLEGGFESSDAFRFDTGYYMNLSRTLLAGNDLPDGVIGHVSLDLYRPEGQAQSPFRSSSSRHYTINASGERVPLPSMPPMTIFDGQGGRPLRVHNADIAWAMRESAKRIMYTTANSNLSNELFNDIRITGQLVEVPEDEDPDDTGCSCGSSGGTAASAGFMLLGLGLALSVLFVKKK